MYSHLNTSPDKQYTYDEWKWYLKLMGEDEGSAETHRPAPIEVEKTDGDEPDLGRGQSKMGEGGEDDQVRQWSWMGNRSPLMGDKGEPEWVLEALCQTLERELKKQREKNRSVKRDRPPVGRHEDSETSSGTLQSNGEPSKR